MPRVKTLATGSAPSDVNIESSDDRSPRNLHLHLLIDVIFINGTAALVTLLGQGQVHHLVGFLFRQRAMGFPTVLGAALASRFPGLFLGRSFRERSRLPSRVALSRRRSSWAMRASSVAFCASNCRTRASRWLVSRPSHPGSSHRPAPWGHSVRCTSCISCISCINRNRQTLAEDIGKSNRANGWRDVRRVGRIQSVFAGSGSTNLRRR